MAEQDLSHVDAIIEELGPLASKQRGAPLRADDWNVLVDAVRELALIARGRAALTADALAANYAPVEHEHLGAVGLSWLDGPTRALVEGRSKTEFAIRDDIARLDKGVGSLRGDVEGLRSEVTGLRELVLQLRDEVIGGNRDVGKVKLRVEALADLELGVDRIGRDFAELDGKLAEVLTLRDKIGEGEGQVDLAGLESRLGSLEQMRQQLIGGSQPPDLRVLQQDLIKLSDRLAGVGPAAPIDLSEASKAQLEQLNQPIMAELASAQTRLDALEGKTASNEALLTQQAETLGKLADYDAGLTRLDALESSVGEFTGKFDLLDGRTASVETQLGALDGKLAGIDGVIAGVLDQKLAGIELGGGGDAEALAGLGARIDQLEGGLGTLDGQFAALGDLDSRFAEKASVEQLAGVLSERSEQIDALAQSFADAGAGLDDLGTRLGTLEGTTSALGDWRATVDGKLGELAKLGEGESSAALALRMSDVETSIATWNTWRSGASGRLDALEIDVAAGNEARTLLADQLAGQETSLAGLGEQVGSLSTSLDGIADWRGTLEGQLETLASRTSELETWKGEAIGELEALEGMKLGELDGRITATESSLATLGQTLGETKLALDGQAARLTSAETSLSTLSKDMSTTKTSVDSLSKTLATTTKTLDSLGTWRTSVDSQLGLIEGKQASLSEWQAGVDSKLISVDQSLGSLSSVGTRLDTLEATSQSLSAWRKQTDVAISSLQVEVVKANELGTRLDKVDSQLISLTASNAKLMSAVKLQPITQPIRTTTTRPLGG